MIVDESFDVSEEQVCAVMSAVHYFDIFKHPLKAHELLEYAHGEILTRAELDQVLHYLVRNAFLFEKNGYYLPDTHYEKIDRRIKGAGLSEKFWTKADRVSRFISRFPYTRSVIISGSLSKGYMDEDSDIDYLIITQPGRLWIARTLLVLYKKIFLLNSHKFFCVNYFLDLNNLVLNDKNLFTATELVFAKPMVNEEVFTGLLHANPWVSEYYPAIRLKEPELENVQPGILKKIIEKMLDGKQGEWLNNLCLNIHDRFWSKKFKNMSREQFKRDMKSSEGVSKHHPNGFRDKILSEHRQRMGFFKNRLIEVAGERPFKLHRISNS